MQKQTVCKLLTIFQRGKNLVAYICMLAEYVGYMLYQVYKTYDQNLISLHTSIHSKYMYYTKSNIIFNIQQIS